MYFICRILCILFVEYYVFYLSNIMYIICRILCILFVELKTVLYVEWDYRVFYLSNIMYVIC